MLQVAFYAWIAAARAAGRLHGQRRSDGIRPKRLGGTHACSRAWPSPGEDRGLRSWDEISGGREEETGRTGGVLLLLMDRRPRLNGSAVGEPALALAARGCSGAGGAGRVPEELARLDGDPEPGGYRRSWVRRSA